MAEHTEQRDARARVMQLANELSRCRQRGLDDLDLRTRNQEPVVAPELERLARAYGTAKGRPIQSRTAAIRTLLQEGLATYAKRGNQVESQLIAALFFDPPDARVKQRPSDRLAATARASGLTTEDQFAERRRSAFLQFAVFLIAFVAATTRAAAAHQSGAAVSTGRQRPVPVIRWRPTKWLAIVGIALAGLVIVSGAFMTLRLTGSHLFNNGTIAPSASATASQYNPAITYREVTGQYSSPTFTDPHSPSVMGPRIKPYEAVQVSCKVFAPTIPSVSPDGYWYLVAGPLPTGKFYAPAGNFLNGDPAIGARKHYTDFAVPDCPS